MGTLRRRAAGPVLLGFFQLCHPVPVLLHTLAVALFALVAAWPKLDARVLLLVIVAHMLMQVSIAALNDYCDRRLDALSKRNKPLVRGLVRPHEALVFGLACIVLMVILQLFLPPLALLLSLLYLALGMVYNLGLKSTPLSGIVFALAIPLVPVYAFVGVGHASALIYWFIPVAALLGVALNLANSLTDIEGDAMQGARTLAVVLGTRGTLFLCPLLVVIAMLLTVLLALTGVVMVVVPLFIAALCVSLLLLAGLCGISLPRYAGLRKKFYFLLFVFCCLVFASGWLGSVFLVVL